MPGSRAASALRLAAIAATALCVACGPDVHEKPKEPRCPPPPEPEHQAVVVGTIGKMHMVESRYALDRLADVLAAFKPDLVLVGARADSFREGRLEDAPFEITYVAHLAKARGIPVEPIDWSDSGAGGADPPEATAGDARETEILRAPKLYTFERANSDELGEKVLSATIAAARGGDPAARRRAWLQHFAMQAASRYGKPKRVLAFVDVLDRPAVDLALRGVGYDGRTPADVLAKTKEVAARGGVPRDVLDAYAAQLARATERAAASSGTEKALWEERARVLSVVVERRAECCVPPSKLEAAAKE